MAVVIFWTLNIWVETSTNRTLCQGITHTIELLNQGKIVSELVTVLMGLHPIILKVVSNMVFILQRAGLMSALDEPIGIRQHHSLNL